MNKARSWLFEKNNEIGKPLANSLRKKVKPQTKHFRNERGNITARETALLVNFVNLKSKQSYRNIYMNSEKRIYFHISGENTYEPFL